MDGVPRLSKICVLGVDPGAMVHANLQSRPPAFLRYTAAPALQVYSKMTVRISPNGMFRTAEKSAADVARAALSTS